MRIKNPKAKGTKFEHDVKRFVKKNDPYCEVFRSPASLGSADLVVIHKLSDDCGVDRSWVQLIQCKYLEKYMSKKETEKLVSDAKRIAASPYLYFREKPRGKIVMKLLG